jgi:uncharacterized protein (TIGR02466 family)
MDKLEEGVYFVSKVYAVTKPEFLETVRRVSEKYLSMNRTTDQQMTVMSTTYAEDPEIADFAAYVSQTAWNILQSQGYDVDNLVTYFTEMWTQEHNAFSNMDYHMHGNGAQISAFYFLDVPSDGCRLLAHDPRPAKVMVNLPAKNDSAVSDASTMVVFNPKPGTLFFTNSWLPHSFTKNMTMEPTRFVHMNLSVAVSPQKQPDVEVV